jgi:hypothetical protein
MEKGIYRNGKIYYHTPIVNALTGGSWEKGWSGTKKFGGLEIVEVVNINDWWTSFNQEVEFELVESKAVIKRLGDIIPHEKADMLCRSF